MHPTGERRVGHDVHAADDRGRHVLHDRGDDPDQRGAIDHDRQWPDVRPDLEPAGHDIADPHHTAADAATTAPPAATTVAPEPLDDLTLIFDGVVPFRFGDRDVDVVPALSAEFGEPVSDAMAEYPTAEEGVFLDPSGEAAFVAPFGRTVCYTNSFCVFFGAGAPETLILTGWRLSDDTPSDLVTHDGIAAGSVLAEYADIITFDPTLSCGDLAFGAADGIDVYLLSADGPFAVPAAGGDGLEILDPDPALVTVSEMRAGELPRDIFDDC